MTIKSGLYNVLFNSFKFLRIFVYLLYQLLLDV